MPDDHSGQWPPPPGAVPPPPGHGGWSAQGTPTVWPQPPAHRPPAHRPGAFPLRPLTLGDIFDGSFRIIRHNAGATVGAAVLVAAVSMALPVLLSALLAFTGWADLSSYVGDPASDALTLGSSGGSAGVDLVTIAFLLGTLLQSVGLVFVTAMGTRVTAAAAVGRKLRLGEAWAETRGVRWRLLGLSLLVGLLLVLAIALYAVPLLLLAFAGHNIALTILFGLIGGVALLCLLVWGWVRIAYLATSTLVLERQGVRSALSRSRELTRGSFWRLLGIGLLTMLVAGVVSQVVSVPVGLLSGIASLTVDAQYALLVSIVGQAAAGIVSAAFATPFLAVVAALQYHDQRIRKEAFDVVLMELAGLTGDAVR